MSDTITRERLDELDRLRLAAPPGPYTSDLDVYEPTDDASIEAGIHGPDISFLLTGATPHKPPQFEQAKTSPGFLAAHYLAALENAAAALIRMAGDAITLREECERLRVALGVAMDQCEQATKRTREAEELARAVVRYGSTGVNTGTFRMACAFLARGAASGEGEK